MRHEVERLLAHATLGEDRHGFVCRQMWTFDFPDRVSFFGSGSRQNQCKHIQQVNGGPGNLVVILFQKTDRVRERLSPAVEGRSPVAVQDSADRFATLWGPRTSW